LFDRICRDDVLERAWEMVRENGGSAGTDGVRIEDVERAGPENVRKELASELRSGLYRPLPVRRVYIPKPQGGERPLGIPCVRDRIVQAAAKLVLEPIFEADFVAVSYGFRPRRNAIEACEVIRLAMNRGEVYVLDLDIRKYFDSIRHRELLELFGRRVSDRRVCRLVRLWLEAGVLEHGIRSETSIGTPQGGVISPLLANIFLHWLDTIWVHRCSHLGTLVRYADDMVVLCRSEAAVNEAKRRIEWVFSRLGLEMHPEKTRIVCVASGTEGFDFLGFHHRKVPSWRWKGKLYGQRWPSKKAMKRIRDRVTELTAPRTAQLPLEYLIGRLNEVLRGWWAYFRQGNSNRQADKLHRHIHERLSRHMARRHKRTGHRWRKYDSDWLQRIGVYRLTGTRYGAPAPGAGRRPPVKGVGEPDEGELHVRNR
jgi:group II intron reverse transcriptase/maturase